MIKKRLFIQNTWFSIFKIAVLINGAALAVILFFIVSRGWRAISWEFLTQAPRDSMTAGGILPCIVGTISLCLVTILVALPIGVASAIYL
ncbi:MAG: phosphate ABC transporter, permease protein PstA, partial [Deltaproteobacteria bacterium]|nr:phosphate ABC transporter, permease protein PstA [Deltaproteobacteria bacterium]